MATGPFAGTQIPLSRQAETQALARYAIPGSAICAIALSAVGVYSIWSTVLYLVDLWRTDPLKSIGAFVPLVSFGLILRAWRAMGWEMRGSWWGIAVLLPTVALVHWRDHAVLELVLSSSWTIFLPPHSLVAFAYVSGVVLLFGGTRLYRAAVFPIALTFLVNPVPHFFNRYIDLPLQHLSATTARSFAHALGQRLTTNELSLMFTPDFGMFIAPGCDGIRGSVTMGFLALVAGFLYRFRLLVWTTVVASAVLLGYGFNLVRLCVLVLYYIVALHLRWLQSRAEMGDYLIGAALFFCATTLLFAVVQRFSPCRDLRPPPLVFSGLKAEIEYGSEGARRNVWGRWIAFAVLVGAGSVSYARRFPRDAVPVLDQAVFPAQLGRYALRRTWQEKLSSGVTIFDWAEYAQPGTSPSVAVGVSPVLGAHDTLLCHTARGEDWLWHRELSLPTASGAVSFSGSFYRDGATEFIEASTVCSGEQCGQWSRTGRHFGFVYSRPEAASWLGGNPERPIPVLLKVEQPVGVSNLDIARAQLQAQMTDFLSPTSIGELTRPYRVR